jgi:hypothetical protein
MAEWNDERLMTAIENSSALQEKHQIDHEIPQTSAEQDYAPLDGKPGL